MQSSRSFHKIFGAYSNKIATFSHWTSHYNPEWGDYQLAYLLVYQCHHLSPYVDFPYSIFIKINTIYSCSELRCVEARASPSPSSIPCHTIETPWRQNLRPQDHPSNHKSPPCRIREKAPQTPLFGDFFNYIY
jgi:hypothetical protein